MGMMELLTVREVAAYLKTTRQQVRRMIQCGELRAVKVGREYRITLAALVWYLFFKRPQVRAERVAVCLIIAGGLGNLIDRVTAGRVIDFFATTFIDFAVFNVADCFVCIGGALWVLAVLLAERKNKKGQANGGA